MSNAKRDDNYVTTLMGVDISTLLIPTPLAVDESNNRLLVSAIITSGGTGGTEYTEDAAAAANPVGTAVNLIRADTPATITTTDGDNVAQRGTNYGAAYSQIVTSAGAFVDTFGGGTQYSDGDVNADPTGTVAMGTDGSNVFALHTDTAGDLQVDVLTMPTTAVTGTFWQATQPVSATDLDIRNLTNVDVITAELSAVDNAVLDTIAAKDFATQTTLSTMNAKFVTGTDIGDVTINNAAGASAVNIQDGGNSITVDGSVTVSGTATVSATDLDIRNLAPATDTVAIGDGTSTATVRNLASNDALNVAITDGSGNQITSFGGGTQYTEGDTDASITGTALMVEGAANALVAAPGTAADGLLVNLGTNNDVTVTGTVAVTQSGTWDEVGINDSGNSITVDNAQLSVVGGGTEATAMRVTIASDSTGVLSVDDNGGSLTVDVGTALPAGTNAIGKLAANSGVDIGDVTLNNTQGAGTSDASTVRTTESTGATGTLSNVSASASSVTVLAANTSRRESILYNDSTSDAYLKFGSTASATSFTFKWNSYSTVIVDKYNGIITAIWDSATGTARVTEVS